MTGDYIVVEGIDGSGTTTCTEELAPRIPAAPVAEPNESLWTGQAVRTALEQKTSNMTDMFLFMADRAEHLERTVKPALESGFNVISDRSHLSTYAYQAHNVAEACNITVENALDRIDIMYGDWNLEPDAVIMLECTVSTALDRCEREDKHENYEQLIDAASIYSEIADRRSDVVFVSTETNDAEETAEIAKQKLQDL